MPKYMPRPKNIILRMKAVIKPILLPIHQPILLAIIDMVVRIILLILIKSVVQNLNFNRLKFAVIACVLTNYSILFYIG